MTRLPTCAAGLFSEPPAVWSPPPLGPGARALVLGVGGGCDVFAAYALSQLWSRTAARGALVMYANCIGERKLGEGHAERAPHLWAVPPTPRPLEPGEDGYGTTVLEQSVPRGPEGSPLLFVVPHGGSNVQGATADDVPRLTAANSAAIHGALRALRVSEILAVDCGGDVLTGGLDFAGDVELGRDRQVLHALQTSGIPFTLLVLGPGCDAESSVPAMTAAVRAAAERGELVGVLPLDEVAPLAASFCAGLSASRTPNVINAAVQRPLAAEGEDELCTITRHGTTQRIPCAWLRLGLALKGMPAA